MTKKELENLVAELRAELATSKQPSTIRQFWTWYKPYLVPFILGAMFGGAVAYSATVCGLPSAVSSTTLEHQAALGGAAIPFRSGNPSPSLLASPPENSKTESTASTLMSTSEPPLPPNPRADNGQIPSTRFYRLPLRLTR